MEQEAVKIPTPGRVVHFFPHESDTHCRANSATKLPATVVQDFSINLNLAVFCMNMDGPVVLRWSIPHRSTVARNSEGNAVTSYWDWPEVNG